MLNSTIFSFILSLKYLFCGKCGPKFQSALFEMKLGSKGYSRVLIPNLIIVFVHFVPKMLFWANLVKKL